MLSTRQNDVPHSEKHTVDRRHDIKKNKQDFLKKYLKSNEKRQFFAHEL